MRVHVLDRFQEGHSEGVLCRVEFADYVSNLPDDFRDYFVQRGITANRYLDNLWETIVEKKHIPLMVLVAGVNDGKPGTAIDITLGAGWKILDGLQRQLFSASFRKHLDIPMYILRYIHYFLSVLAYSRIH